MRFYLCISALLLAFYVSCQGKNVILQKESLKPCIQYKYDKNKNAWYDNDGKKKKCQLIDHINIFPLYEGRCEHWKEFFDLKNQGSETDASSEDDEFIGDKIEFHRILVAGKLVCLRQRIFDLGGVAVFLEGENQCLVPKKQGQQVVLVPCEE